MNIDFDVLRDVLETLRFRGTIFFRSQLAAPWGMKLKPTNMPRFHISLDGRCVVGSDEAGGIVELRPMEIVMLPHGDMHWIADQPNRELVPSERAGAACELGQPMFQQGDITNRLICGLVDFDREMLHPILDALPNVMHFKSIADDDPIWLNVQLLDREMEQHRHKHSAVIDRLTEVLFLQLLYRHVEMQPESRGFLAALHDPGVHRLLALIHAEPDRSWTLESLGQRVGMSRSTVARRFQRAVGQPPLTYLGNWRMMKAHYLTRNSVLSFEEIADRVGFASARSLSKAFQRHYGQTPAQLRGRKRATNDAATEQR